MHYNKRDIGSILPVAPLAITRTNGPWAHTSDDSYIYHIYVARFSDSYCIFVSTACFCGFYCSHSPLQKQGTTREDTRTRYRELLNARARFSREEYAEKLSTQGKKQWLHALADLKEVQLDLREVLASRCFVHSKRQYTVREDT